MMLERASSRLRFVTPSVSGTTTHSAISPAGPLRHLGFVIDKPNEADDELDGGEEIAHGLLVAGGDRGNRAG